MFAYIKFLCGNIRLRRVAVVSPDTGVAVIFFHESVTNFTFLDAIMLKTGAKDDERYISIHLLASELKLVICCVLLAIRAISERDSVSTFSHIEKIATF